MRQAWHGTWDAMGAAASAPLARWLAPSAMQACCSTTPWRSDADAGSSASASAATALLMQLAT